MLPDAIFGKELCSMGLVQLIDWYGGKIEGKGVWMSWTAAVKTYRCSSQSEAWKRRNEEDFT